MAKSSGIGDNFLYGGYDLSGDVASVDKISGGPALLDVTPISKAANVRIGGLRDGSMSFTSYFESSASQAVTAPGVPATTVPVVSAYNVPVLVTVIGGTGTQVNINGVNQGSFDGTYLLPAFGTIILTFTVAPTWSWVAVGTEHDVLSALSRNDQGAMYLHGAAMGNPVACLTSKQINYDLTRDNKGGLTLKCDLQANGFGVEWGNQATAGLRIDTTATVGAFYDDAVESNFGAQAYLQLTEIIGTSVDITVTHCATSGGSYTTLMDFGAKSAIGSFRQSVSNVTTVHRYIEIVSAGTFTYAAFAVALVRNKQAGQVF